jgi:sugar/nucleoside kinase (ribokinase family)
VRLVADVGDDELGGLLLRALAAVTADASGVQPVAGAATSYSVVLQPPGSDRMFWHHVGANAGFDGRRIDVAAGDLLHVGYPPLLPAMLTRRATPLRRLLARARESGMTTSVDFAVVPPSSRLRRSHWASVLEAVLLLSDVVTPSLDDLASMVGPPFDPQPRGSAADGPSAAAAWADRLVTLGAAVVLVTAGRHGLLLRTAGRERLARGGRVLAPLAERWPDHESWVPAAPVQGSTRGAGDAATAGLLFGLLAGMEPAEAARLAAAAARRRILTSGPLPSAAILAAQDGSPD